jgi:chromosomal replication initiator protein
MDINNLPIENDGSIFELNESIQPNPTKELWLECLKTIKTRVNSQSYKTWFEPIVPRGLDRNRFTIQVPSQFFQEWLEEHHYSLLNEVLTQTTGREIAVDFLVKEDESVSRYYEDNIYSSTSEPFSVRSPDSLPPVGKRIEISKESFYDKNFDSGLNPRYTFEHYIKGESNQFARAAAQAVANNPGGTSFNPLVIYGGVGLGKTHLVHAIGNQQVNSGKQSRVLYISSEKFTVDFVDAIQKDSINEFSNFYRSVDLLIVDDIQFFAGKEKTQDYFFHTFNALHQQGKQIVLSCDRPPKELKGLNERLISRFQWGLTADIQPPDLEMRIAILQKKSTDDGVELSHSVIEFIASNVTTNIRQLEGCLIGLLARASLENRRIDLELAKDVVRSVIGEVRTHITIEEIQKVVCEHLDIPEDLLRAKTRKQEIVNARQIAMYLAKEMTNSSLKTIGLHFGGRDHSTVIHAYQTVEDSMSNDVKQQQIVKAIRAKLENLLH